MGLLFNYPPPVHRKRFFHRHFTASFPRSPARSASRFMAALGDPWNFAGKTVQTWSRSSDPSDTPMAHRWPSALPGDLRRGKQRKLHKTSLIWAFKAAGHPFSGGCQVLHFWCKDAGACRLFSACFYPRALVREFSTGANVAHHRRICDSPDYFCSCTDYRTHQGSNSHTFTTQRKTFSSFRLGYAISQSSRPL